MVFEAQAVARGWPGPRQCAHFGLQQRRALLHRANGAALARRRDVVGAQAHHVVVAGGAPFGGGFAPEDVEAGFCRVDRSRQRAGLAARRELAAAALVAVRPGGGLGFGAALALAHGSQPAGHWARAEHRAQIHLAEQAGVAAVARVDEVGVHQQQAHALHRKAAARGHVGPKRDIVHVAVVAHGRVAQLEQAQAVFARGQNVDAHLGAVFAGEAGAEDGPAFGRRGIAVETVQRVAHGLQPLRRVLRRGDRVGVRERGTQRGVQPWALRGLRFGGRGPRHGHPALQLAARQPEAAFAVAPAAQVVGVEGRSKNHGRYQTKPTQDRTGTGTKATGAGARQAFAAVDCC